MQVSFFATSFLSSELMASIVLTNLFSICIHPLLPKHNHISVGCFSNLLGGFDGSFYPPLEGTPRQYTIVKANRYMVNTADAMICYVCHIGNTRNLLEYAQRRKKDGVRIENVAEDN